MVRKWKLGATGTALLASAFVIVACSSKSDDDSNGSGGKGGTGASGGSAGSATAGKGGTGTGGTGGSTTGGTGGSTTGGTGGSTTGGTAGMSMGGMSAGGATGFACASPAAASCNYITTWGTFSNGTFGGGLYVYGNLTQDTTDTGEFHASGMVTDYSGIGIYFNSCSDVSQYTNVTFTLSGTSGNTKPESLWYIIQQNSDEPPDTTGMKGDCNGKPGNPCQSPYTHFTVGDSPETINFADLSGGVTVAPVTTDGKLDAKQVIGMQWQFRPETAGYAVDIKLDNLSFGTGTAAGGSGGMGAGGAGAGASAGGAASGGAGSGAGGASGGKAGAGTAGASADMVTQVECTAAAMAGMGGMSGSAGATGSGGAAAGTTGSGGAAAGTTGAGGAGAGGRNDGGRGGRGTAGAAGG